MGKDTLIQESTFEKARKKILEEKKKNPEAEIIFSSNDDELNRKILEKLKIDILLLNESGRNDFQKQRNSGLNQILAREMKKNSINLGINLDELMNNQLTKKQKAQILARIKQNIKLCNKNKIQVKFISLSEKEKKDSYDLKSLGLVLGMPTWMIKNLF